MANEKQLKIGILSINYPTAALNLACPLHSAVFSKVLNELGYENVIVDYHPDYYVEYVQKNSGPHVKMKWVNLENQEEYESKVMSWMEMTSTRKKRYNKIQTFYDNHYTFSENRYTSDSMDQLDSAEGINCYIAATDIIWEYRATQGGFDKGFFMACRAMRNSYKIAYAASRRKDNYKGKAKQEFINLIKNIPSISVRERTFSESIAAISGIKPDVVLDPVFLKDKEFYRKLMASPERKSYVLVYIVVESADNLVKLAAKFAEVNDLDLIELSQYSYHKEQTGYQRHIVICDTGVEEWIGYINNADYIFTNSFHGCCLSIILEKQVFHGERTEEKVDLIMETFGLQWRKAEEAINIDTGEALVGDIDCLQINITRKELVHKSMNFLINALKNAERFVNRKSEKIEIGQERIMAMNLSEHRPAESAGLEAAGCRRPGDV